MQLLAITTAVFASLALAAPAAEGGGDKPKPPTQQYDPCLGLSGDAQCCATDVLGLVNLDCHSPPELPGSPSDFQSICADLGQRARCCVVPVLGQALLCDTPVGISG